MTIPFKITDTVGAIVAQCPSLSRVFEKAGIDYCCGGKVPLAEACQKKGLDPAQFIFTLEQVAAAVASGPTSANPASMTLTELTRHIESTHHVYLQAEIPRLLAMTDKVARVHGEHDARLAQVRDTFAALAQAMHDHTQREEQAAFPSIRDLEAGQPARGETVVAQLRQMEAEHDKAGAALAKLRELTDGYRPPEWACNTYRAMLDGLEYFEHDLHQHVHKENNILHPRAVALEAGRQPA